MELRKAANSRCERSTYHTSSAAQNSARPAKTSGVTSQPAAIQPHTAMQAHTTSNTTRRPTCRRKLLKTMTRHLAIQRGAAQAQRLRGLGEIALELAQRALNRTLLEFIQVQHRLLTGASRNRGGRQHHAVEGKAAVFTHDHGTLD